jgi:hypothetical protein
MTPPIQEIKAVAQEVAKPLVKTSKDEEILSLNQFAKLKKETTEIKLFDEQPAKVAERSPEKSAQPVKKTIFEKPVFVDLNKSSV